MTPFKTTPVAALVVASLLVLGYGTLAAQRPAHPATPPPPHGMAPAPSHAQPAGPNDVERSRGIATKLGTTADALKQAYDAARATNSKLTWGQFIAANVLAHNLGAKNSKITTDAILLGLQGGKSIGQTLQGLGLSEKDAKEAEEQARKEIRDSQK